MESRRGLVYVCVCACVYGWSVSVYIFVPVSVSVYVSVCAHVCVPLACECTRSTLRTVGIKGAQSHLAGMTSFSH